VSERVLLWVWGERRVRVIFGGGSNLERERKGNQAWGREGKGMFGNGG